MTREQLIEKIQNLLALSSCESTTEHERNLAYQRAQSLMAKYCIEDKDLQEGNIIDRIIEFTITYQPSGYLKNDNIYKFIISEIAQAFGTFYFMRGGKGYYLMGFEANCYITDQVIHSLINQGIKDYRNSLKENAPTAAHKISFWKGFHAGLKDRFIKLSDERAIILYDKVKEKFMSQVEFIKLNQSRSNSNTGYEDGKDSAKKAQIHKPLRDEKHEIQIKFIENKQN